MGKPIGAGDLNRRVTIRFWSDIPNVAFGLDQTFDDGLERWAKVEPIYGLNNRGDEQTGEVPTHFIWVRWTAVTAAEAITNGHVVEWQGRRYRVMNTIDFEDGREWLRISVKDLGVIA